VTESPFAELAAAEQPDAVRSAAAVPV
jgi:hypothetical protein